MNKILVEDDSQKMRASTEWMAVKYAEMNEELFDGELGQCDFGIFTTGRGSQGGILGWFKITASGVKANRSSRRMYRENNYYSFSDDTIWINKSNFYEVCRPKIELNGHYSGTEESLTETLVHEMCHYYTYMHGYCPRQSHGSEFREIASYVSSRSNGRFTISKLASAESMRGYELDADMQAKRDAMVANKKSRMIGVFVFKDNGQVQLSLTTKKELADYIVERNTARVRNGASGIKKIITSKDAGLLNSYMKWVSRRHSEHIDIGLLTQPY